MVHLLMKLLLLGAVTAGICYCSVTSCRPNRLLLLQIVDDALVTIKNNAQRTPAGNSGHSKSQVTLDAGLGDASTTSCS